MRQAIGQNPLSYLGVKEKNPPELHFRNRAPLTADVKGYDVGDIWVNTSAGLLYFLTLISGTLANWQAIGTISSVGADSGLATPISGSIMLTAENGLETSALGNTITYRFTPLLGFTGSQREYRQVSVQTFDATPTILFELAIAEEEMVTIKGFINGFNASFTECIGGDVLATFYRPTGGNLTVVGSPVININYTSAGVPNFTIAANIGTQSINLNAVGEAAKTYNWTATLKYSKLLTNA